MCFDIPFDPVQLMPICDIYFMMFTKRRIDKFS